MGHKSNSSELQKRIHLVSLMLRRKSTQFILDYGKREWGVQRVQMYNYIKEAKVEWAKYFSHLKKCGMGYHVTQLRDLKDKAFRKKTIIGAGKDKKVVYTPNLPLILDIAREEAKLMGAYPAERHEVSLTTNFADWIKKVKEKKESKEKANIGRHKPGLVEEERKVQIENTRRVPEGVIIEGEIEEVKEESQMRNEIARKAPDNGGEESRKIDAVEEESQMHNEISRRPLEVVEGKSKADSIEEDFKM